MDNPDPIRIPLRNRQGEVRAYALVDPVDQHLAEFRWCLSGTGYANRCIFVDGHKKGVTLHRVVLGLEIGDPRQGDHINRDRLDCRRANLRIVTTTQNNQNLAPRHGTSKFRGVSWLKRDQKWRAESQVNGVRRNLGHFMREEDAAEAARAFRAKYMPYATD